MEAAKWLADRGFGKALDVEPAAVTDEVRVEEQPRTEERVRALLQIAIETGALAGIGLKAVPLDQ